MTNLPNIQEVTSIHLLIGRKYFATLSIHKISLYQILRFAQYSISENQLAL